METFGVRVSLHADHTPFSEAQPGIESSTFPALFDFAFGQQVQILDAQLHGAALSILVWSGLDYFHFPEVSCFPCFFQEQPWKAIKGCQLLA